VRSATLAGREQREGQRLARCQKPSPRIAEIAAHIAQIISAFVRVEEPQNAADEARIIAGILRWDAAKT